MEKSNKISCEFEITYKFNALHFLIDLRLFNTKKKPNYDLQIRLRFIFFIILIP